MLVLIKNVLNFLKILLQKMEASAQNKKSQEASAIISQTRTDATGEYKVIY